MKNLLTYDRPNLWSEPKSANDATFAGSLGLNMFQETHKTSADVDIVTK